MGDYSEFVVILDRSGSMQAARSDHEGGLNSFVRDQRELAGDVRFTFIRFDTQNPCEVVYDGTPIEKVGPCDLIPRGGTPLLDAVGKGIAHVAARLDGAKPKPDQVVVMVITDGEENSSHEWTKERIRAAIEEREKQHGWKFLFLGANVDSFAEAGALGVAAGATMDFANNQIGTHGLYASVSANATASRLAAKKGLCSDEVYANWNFTDAQRSASSGAVDTNPPVVVTGTTNEESE